MGLLSAIFSGADEAAAGADEAGATQDEVQQAVDDVDFVSNDETARSFESEATDGVNSGGGYVDFSSDGFRQRVAADFTGRLAEQPSRAADAASSNLGSGLKWIGGGTAGGLGLYAGSQAYSDYTDLQAQESREQTYSEYQRRREEIRNDDSLSPDQKEEALAALERAYQQAINQGNEGGFLARIFGGMFEGMGIMEKGMVLVAVVIVFRLAQEGMS